MSWSHATEAERELPAGLWAYLAGASETGAALRRNRTAPETWALLPRVLVDVSRTDSRTRLLGRELALPLQLPPVGSLHRVHPEGVVGWSAAAREHGLAYAVGSALPGAGHMEALPDACALYQLYVDGDDDWLAQQSRAASTRGFAGVVLTVETPVTPVRPADIATGNHAAGRAGAEPNHHRRAFDWAALQRLRASRNPA